MKHLHIPTYFEALSEIVGNENLTGGLTDGPMSGIGFAEGISKPTEEAIQTKLASMISDWDAQAYARNRAIEYPSITDVTVALAEKAEGSSTMWDKITAERLAVKAKYPKP